jgi:hypothetical protein
MIISKPWWWFWALCFVCMFAIFYSRERTLKGIEAEENEHQKHRVELELRTLQL